MTGSRGQLGRSLVAAIEARDGETLACALSHADLDVSDAAQVRGLFDGVPGGADVLVNAAAFTNVDRCETEPERAFAVNAQGPGLLAEACRAADVHLVHVSTDYVFDGRADVPYDETMAVAPRSAYGRSKEEGERRVWSALPGALVLRTSWVFGPGRNFVVAILEQAAKRRRGEASGPLRVVSDQRGAPTYAVDLADGILSLVPRFFARGGEAAGGADPAALDRSPGVPPGLFHLTNAGETTWHGFAREILRSSGYEDLGVEPISTDALSLPAPRPAYSVLDCGRAARLGVRLRSWREALAAYLESAAPAALLGEAS